MSTGQVGVQDAAGSDSVSKPRGARSGSTVIFVQDLEVSTTFSRVLLGDGRRGIWTAADEEDLERCERFLRDRSAHVQTMTLDGFRVIEGRDPSRLPVVMTYPGPDEVARHQIMSRIYAW